MARRRRMIWGKHARSRRIGWMRQSARSGCSGGWRGASDRLFRSSRSRPRQSLSDGNGNGNDLDLSATSIEFRDACGTALSTFDYFQPPDELVSALSWRWEARRLKARGATTTNTGESLSPGAISPCSTSIQWWVGRH